MSIVGRQQCWESRNGHQCDYEKRKLKKWKMTMTQRHTSEGMTVSLKENKPGGEEIFKVVLEYISESTAI